MSNIELMVISGGFGLIAAIAYYFFGPKNESENATLKEGAMKASVVVDAAYIPSELRIKVGIPTDIEFDRRDKGDCTEWVIFENLPTKEGKKIKARLGEGKKTSVSFTPTKVGKYRFSCGMGMVHGQLVVEK